MPLSSNNLPAWAENKEKEEEGEEKTDKTLTCIHDIYMRERMGKGRQKPVFVVGVCVFLILKV